MRLPAGSSGPNLTGCKEAVRASPGLCFLLLAGKGRALLDAFPQCTGDALSQSSDERIHISGLNFTAGSHYKKTTSLPS